MKDAYVIIAFLWVVGWLYTRGLAWMVSKYEHWESEHVLERKSSNEMWTFFAWPWVLGLLHAPAFIDKKFASRNKQSTP